MADDDALVRLERLSARSDPPARPLVSTGRKVFTSGNKRFIRFGEPYCKRRVSLIELPVEVGGGFVGFKLSARLLGLRGGREKLKLIPGQLTSLSYC